MSSEITSNDDVPIVIGYECTQLVANNADQLIDFELTWFMDVANPMGQQQPTLEHLQSQLIARIATRYGISTATAQACLSPPIDGSSWILRFSLETTDFEEIDLFGGCRTLEGSSPELQDCNFYQVTLKGSYIGSSSESSTSSSVIGAVAAEQLDDLVRFLEATVNGAALTADLNALNLVADGSMDLYETKFDGVPVADESNITGGDEARDNLNDPVNGGDSTADGIMEGQQQQQNSNSDRTTITIVGGLLVAAFAIAFFGICYILWRRRQYFMRSRQVHMHQWEQGLDSNGEEVDGKQFELEQYNTSHTEEEKDGGEYGDGSGNYVDGQPMDKAGPKQQMVNDASMSLPAGEMDESKDSPNAAGAAMQFDLGTSFKDQLMGVYGSRGGNGSNLNLQIATNSSKRGGQLGSLFPATHSVDGDSDADSWAQTDGTIGSLEIGLEPITAEV